MTTEERSDRVRQKKEKLKKIKNMKMEKLSSSLTWSFSLMPPLTTKWPLPNRQIACLMRPSARPTHFTCEKLLVASENFQRSSK